MTGDPLPAAVTLTAEDREAIHSWCAACRQNPGSLPSGIEPVQTRLIRQVGRGTLPSGTTAFVKVMAFPRAKDRLRYAFRRLPAEHEADMLRFVGWREGAPPCPEVLHVEARRAWFLPRLSILVTKGLDLDEDPEPVSFLDSVRVAERLARLGIEHPDLHRMNILRLSGGELAILDLQSAKAHAGPLGASARERVAVKLLEYAEDQSEQHFDTLVENRLIDEAGRESLRRLVQRSEAENVWRRIARCLRVSTEFERTIGLRQIEHRRRASDGSEAEAIEAGAEARALWIGDRAREILDGSAPLLHGYARPWWRPSRSSVYIAGTEAGARLEALRAELLDGYRRALEWRARAKQGAGASTS